LNKHGLVLKEQTPDTQPQKIAITIKNMCEKLVKFSL